MPDELPTLIAADDWVKTLPAVQSLVLELLDMVRQLSSEVQELRVRVNQTARNSSQPPSSDPPHAPPAPARRSAGRKRGAQPGHATSNVRSCRSSRSTNSCYCSRRAVWRVTRRCHPISRMLLHQFVPRSGSSHRSARTSPTISNARSVARSATTTSKQGDPWRHLLVRSVHASRP